MSQKVGTTPELRPTEKKNKKKYGSAYFPSSFYV